MVLKEVTVLKWWGEDPEGAASAGDMVAGKRKGLVNGEYEGVEIARVGKRRRRMWKSIPVAAGGRRSEAWVGSDDKLRYCDLVCGGVVKSLSGTLESANGCRRRRTR